MGDPEDFAVMLVAKTEEARKRATCALMEAGGEHGFGWRFKRVYDGGLFLANPDDASRDDVTFTLLYWMQGRQRPFLHLGKEWLLNNWREWFTDKQLADFNQWRAECHERETGQALKG